MNSKLELRNEAVRLAVNMKDVNPDNVIEVAKKIEYYILGKVELPESFNIAEQSKDMMKTILESYKPNENSKIKTIYEPDKIKAEA